MYKGQCHCGNVVFTVSAEPTHLVDCNCSLCYRLGALWAHIPVDSFNLVTCNTLTMGYAHGDKTLAVQTCKHCGCTTHYETLQKDVNVMAVNFRMCGSEALQDYPIRKFDGANTWEYLDEESSTCD